MNFKLYIECLSTKYENVDYFEEMDHEKFTYTYLSNLLNAYEKMINVYFKPIKHLFEPFMDYSDDTEYDIGIIGCFDISCDFLNYMLIMIKKNEQKVRNIEVVKFEKFKKLIRKNY